MNLRYTATAKTP